MLLNFSFRKLHLFHYHPSQFEGVSSEFEKSQLYGLVVLLCSRDLDGPLDRFQMQEVHIEQMEEIVTVLTHSRHRIAPVTWKHCSCSSPCLSACFAGGSWSPRPTLFDTTY